MTYKPQADAIIDGTIVDADVASANKDGTAGTPSLRTLGTGATQAAPGNTVELLANKAAAGGYASLDGSTRVPVAQLGSSSGSATTFLNGTGAFSTPTATVTISTSTKTGAYTITSSDDVILADGASAAFAVTLPTAVGVTKLFTVKRVNTGVNSITVGTTSAQTIDGATTYVISQQYASITVASNGANWFIV